MLDVPPPSIHVETEASVTSEESSFRLSTESPLLFVDGYLFACEYDGDACIPIFGISIPHFVDVVRRDLSNTSEATSKRSPALPRRIRSSTFTSSPSHSPSRPRRRISAMLGRESQTPLLHSEAEDFLGISYENVEHQPRSSYIVPLVHSHVDLLETAECLTPGEDDSKKREFEASPVGSNVRVKIT